MLHQTLVCTNRTTLRIGKDPGIEYISKANHWQFKCEVWLCFRSLSADRSWSVLSHQNNMTSRPLALPQPHPGWDQKFSLLHDCCSTSVEGIFYYGPYQCLVTLAYRKKLQETALERVFRTRLCLLAFANTIDYIAFHPYNHQVFSLSQIGICLSCFIGSMSHKLEGRFPCTAGLWIGRGPAIGAVKRSIDMFVPDIFSSS